MKKHSRSLKKIIICFIAIVMLWTSICPMALNVSATLATPVKGVQCNDYRGWAQDDPRWYNIVMNQNYCKEITLYHAGCAVISYTKLLIQSKVKTTSFLPSDMTAWMENNNGYVKQTGKAYAVWENLANISPLVTYGGKVSLTSTTDDAYEADLIMDAINDGYYIIVGVKSDGHWVVVDNETSKKLGYPVIWNTAKGCSNPASYNVGQKLFSKYDTCSSIVKYKVATSSSTTTNKTYTIQYKANGGTGTMADTTVTYGVTTNLRANTFTREGYTFKGWNAYRTSDQKWYYKNSAGIGQWCIEGQQPSGYNKHLYPDKVGVAETTSVDKDIVYFYAVWEANDSSSETEKTYTIQYKANGGTGTMADTTVNYGVSTQILANTFAREGYTFKGWNAYRTSDQKWFYTNSSGTGQWCTEGQQPSGYAKYVYINKAYVSTTSSVDKDIVYLYAVWEAKTSSSQIFYPIDLSSSVLKSRINQQVDRDCAVVSMATIEAYLYEAQSSANKTTVYNALVSKNKDNDYANWSNCGYITATINWTTVYNQLAKGYPCIVHRPASGSKKEHWAVVAGYTGSSTTIEKDKFIVVDVYHGSGGTDIYTSGSWRNGTTIDRMAYRKNGISITSLSGIKFAIDHPAVLHKNGNGHGVYGYITSNENLTSINFLVTNIKTGEKVFNKTITPNAKSYLIYNLDAEFTFAKWANGDYFITICAKTASTTRYYHKYFRIASSYPTTKPTISYIVNFNYNNGTNTIETQTINWENTFTVTSSIPEKDGYTFAGWNVLRVTDGKWYVTSVGWCSKAEIDTNGYSPRVYEAGDVHRINFDWVINCYTNRTYNFYPVWVATEEEIDPNEPPLVEEEAPNDESVGSAAPEEDYVGSGEEYENGDDSSIFEEIPEYLLGDVDNNGKIEADDYILLKRIFFGTASIESLDSPETAFARCDVDCNGKIEADDYILLKRVYFGTAKLG